MKKIYFLKGVAGWERAVARVNNFKISKNHHNSKKKKKKCKRGVAEQVWWVRGRGVNFFKKYLFALKISKLVTIAKT